MREEKQVVFQKSFATGSSGSLVLVSNALKNKAVSTDGNGKLLPFVKHG